MTLPDPALRSEAETYLRALHEGDVDRLRAVFLPEANLYASIDQTLTSMTLSAYLELVSGRPSPASQGHAPSGRVLSIDPSGPDSAVVKASVSVPPKTFVDLLSYLRINGRWRIIAKVYHVED